MVAYFLSAGLSAATFYLIILFLGFRRRLLDGLCDRGGGTIRHQHPRDRGHHRAEFHARRGRAADAGVQLFETVV